jgi:8-oxo-dGTP pyrophosphatase MutT (NUDIX family)
MASDVPIRRAATVVLVRDGATGLQVYSLQRTAALDFAAGVLAFPGGGVDPTDRLPVPPHGRSASWWAERLEVTESDAGEILAAAVRELFEETGVLLGAAATGGAEAVERDRLRVELAAHRSGIAAVLVEQGVATPFDALVPWARWITPPGQSRRYDTFFFVAAVPPGQQPEMLTSEADHGRWDRPVDLLEAHAAGELAIMPPTLATLHQIGALRSVAEVLAAQRVIRPIRPRVVSAPGEPMRVEVDGQEFAVGLQR